MARTRGKRGGKRRNATSTMHPNALDSLFGPLELAFDASDHAILQERVKREENFNAPPTTIPQPAPSASATSTRQHPVSTRGPPGKSHHCPNCGVCVFNLDWYMGRHLPACLKKATEDGTINTFDVKTGERVKSTHASSSTNYNRSHDRVWKSNRGGKKRGKKNGGKGPQQHSHWKWHDSERNRYARSGHPSIKKEEED